MDRERLAAALPLALTLACASPGQPGRSGVAPPAEAANEPCATEDPPSGDLFGRTELVFGAARADGPSVTRQEWQAFVEAQIAPRFPRGMTVLAAQGRFLGADGVAVREDSFVVILLYPLHARDSSQKIEEIRAAYKHAFHQESVLRIDSRTCVSF